MEALTDSDGKQTKTITEKGEMLRRESFPLNEDKVYYEQPRTGQAHESISWRAVARALYGHSISESPGPAKLSCNAVHLLCVWETQRIVELARQWF